MNITIEKARDAKKKLNNMLTALNLSVAGIGIGQNDNKEYVIAVRVFDTVSASKVPSDVDGVKVVVEVVGEIKSQ